MNFLRILFCLLTLSNFAAAIKFMMLGGWWWLLALACIVTVYVMSEITHTMFKKPTMPHPESLAFQKEVIERYNI